MNRLAKKIKSNFWVIKYLPQTLYFNFHYLPFKKAIHLPIFLYKPKFVTLKGSINIDSENIHIGMIKLGINNVSIYPNNGIVLEIDGIVNFKGTCNIGNNSALSVKSKTSGITIGNNFNATTSLKVVCYNKITIGEDVLIGWNCIICDTDFHSIINLNNNTETNLPHSLSWEMGYISQLEPIVIGNHVWIAHNCSIHKGSIIPSNIVVAAKSLVNKKLDVPPFSMVAGCPSKLKRTNIDWK